MGKVLKVVHFTIISFTVITVAQNLDLPGILKTPTVSIPLEKRDLDNPPFFGQRQSVSSSDVISGNGNQAARRSAKRCAAIVKSINDDKDTFLGDNSILHQTGPIQWQNRCLWILSGTAATEFTLHITKLDDIGSANNDDASGFGMLISGASYEREILSTLNNVDINDTLTVHANVVFIILWSKGETAEDIGSGILIDYKMESEANGQVAPASADSIHRIIRPEETVSHPPTFTNILETSEAQVSSDHRRELSSYVFVPTTNSIKQEGPYRNRKYISYTRENGPIDHECELQKVEIFKLEFENGTAPSWRRLWPLCDNMNYIQIITVDVVIMLVKSKRAAGENGRAFTLSYSDRA